MAYIANATCTIILRNHPKGFNILITYFMISMKVLTLFGAGCAYMYVCVYKTDSSFIISRATSLQSAIYGFWSVWRDHFAAL